MDRNKKIKLFKGIAISVTSIFIIITVILSITVLISIGLTALRFVKVGDIEVVGMSPYDKFEINEVLKLKRTDLWWDIDEEELEEKLLEELPQIEKVKVKKKLPNNIEINVIESRTPRWYIDLAGRKYSVDSDMYVIEDIKNTDGLTKLVLPNLKEALARQVPKFGQSETEVKKTLEIIDTVRHSDLRPHITELDVSDRSNIRLMIDGRYKANLGNSDDLAGKLTAINAALGSDHVKNSPTGEFNAVSYPKDGYVGFSQNVTVTH